jgi:hypothetical protein
MDDNSQHRTKIIAYYLPQFHEVEENNHWWGKGFTEWTNVKSAVPLYHGHQQPKVPLNQNYYNLMNKDTVMWQTKLANDYGIYGMAYYHYWFSGKMLLEKPAENLLKWKDIQQNFFFFWANHTWYKTKDGKKQVLIKQEYGDSEDWKNHFTYMNQFFQDERYIKVDNRPVVGIHLPEDIVELDAMIELWNHLAKENGFDGVYIIESSRNSKKKFVNSKSSATIMRQPDTAKYLNNLKVSGKLYDNKLCRWGFRVLRLLMGSPKHPRKLDYQMLADYEIQVPESDGSVLYCVSTGWDNTPRHGCRGEVMINRNPQIYYQKLKTLYFKSIEAKNEFLFINAWNEWAEGMYLEPDEEDGYAYLEATRKVCDETKQR